MTLNDKKETLNVSGKGTLSVPLTDGENTLELTYSTAEGLSFAVTRAIYLDRVAPEIRLYEPLEAKTFATSKLVITGETEGNAVLTINDKAVTLKENGSFAFTVSLNTGENLIRLKAVDPAGNASVQVLTVNRRSFLTGGVQNTGGWTDWLPLMIAGGVSVLGIGAALLFFKKRPPRERKPKPVKKGRALLVMVWVTGSLTLLSAAGTVLSLLRYLALSRQVNSASYLTLAETSFKDAYLLLVSEQRWWTILWILAAAALALLALTVVLILLYCRRKKRLPRGTQPAVPPPSPPAPPASIPPQA